MALELKGTLVLKPLPLTLLLLVSYLFPAAGSPPPDSVYDAWLTGNTVDVRMTQGDGADWAQYTYLLSDDGELDIRVESSQSGRKTSGHVMFLSNTLLVRGLDLQPGREQDALDVPMLEFQVLIKLLAYATQARPDEIKTRITTSYTETRDALVVTTISASGTFRPVWIVEGSVEPKSLSTVAFDLQFSRTEKTGTTERTRYRGTWGKVNPGPRLSPATPLPGLTAYALGIQKSHPVGPSGSQFVSVPVGRGFKDVSELRAWAKANQPKKETPRKK